MSDKLGPAPQARALYLGANPSTSSGQALGATPHDTSLLGTTHRRRTLGGKLEDGNELLRSDFEDHGNRARSRIFCE